MPWLEPSPKEQPERFIRHRVLDLYAIAELSTNGSRGGVRTHTVRSALGIPRVSA
jgi:hypothetical protein